MGDIRVNFTYIPGHAVSAIGGQRGSVLVSYPTKNGNISVLANDVAEPEVMLNEQIAFGNTLGWILRVVGVLLMFLGFSTSFSILPVIASVIPSLGRVTGFIHNVVLFIVSLALSLVIIALGWLFYRPVAAFAIIAAAVLLIVLLMKRVKTKRVDSGIA